MICAWLYHLVNALQSWFTVIQAKRNMLTTANRLLRLYAGTADPTQNLTTLAEFILKVYAPV